MIIPSSEPMPPPPQTTSKPPASAARRKPTPESSAAANPPPPPPPPPRCPRCDSANTKFCYYNNYSLSQPRHFCKSCRRYWTKGGSLRNIPIGGGCRKTKKPSSSSTAAALAGDLKLFHGISSPSSSSMPDHFPPLNLNPFTTTGSNLLGLNSFNFPFTMDGGGGGGGGGGSAPILNMASSIESLSAQNLELHWKLQQQRMSLLYGGETDSMINLKPPTTTTSNNNNNNYQKELHQEAGGPTSFVDVGPVVVEKPQPIYFQNLEAVTTNNAKPDNVVVHTCGNDAGNEAAATEWFFDGGSYGGGGGNNPGNGKEEESHIINGKNATNGLNDDGSCCGQGWADDDDQFHHFNGLV